jgi:hypothetical protein
MSSSVSIHWALASLQQSLQYEWPYAGGLAHCTEANGAIGVQIHSFFTLKLRSLVAVPPAKNPLVLVKQEDGRAQYPVWTLWKLGKLSTTDRNQKVNPTPPNYQHQNFKIHIYD